MAIKRKTKRLLKVGYLTARVYDNNSASILVKVPVTMSTIPEVPEVIVMDNWAATLFSTNPLAYRAAIFARAIPSQPMVKMKTI